MKIKIAVIAAAGEGKRLRPLTFGIPKCLIRINGKPLIGYTLELLEKLGIEETVIITDYMRDKIIEYANSKKNNFKINFVRQKNRYGIAHAIGLVKNLVNEPFIAMLGDEFYLDTNHNDMLENLKEKKFDCAIAVKKTSNKEDIKKNYAVKFNKNFEVIDVKEKPNTLWNDYLGCGTYVFKPIVFDYIDKTPFSKLAHEKEITNTIKLMIEDERAVSAFPLTGFYVNINYPPDIEKIENFFVTKRESATIPIHTV